MDLYTACNLLTLCPRDIPTAIFSEFLEQRLMIAVQLQGSNGFDIRNALEHIIKTYDQSVKEERDDAEVEEDQRKLWTNKPDPFSFSYMERELASNILSAIANIKG